MVSTMPPPAASRARIVFSIGMSSSCAKRATSSRSILCSSLNRKSIIVLLTPRCCDPARSDRMRGDLSRQATHKL